MEFFSYHLVYKAWNRNVGQLCILTEAHDRENSFIFKLRDMESSADISSRSHKFAESFKNQFDGFKSKKETGNK
jgi:hypothetical protein